MEIGILMINVRSEMAEWNSTIQNATDPVAMTSRRLFGRRKIVTEAREITRENVLHEIVEKAHLVHLQNKKLLRKKRGLLGEKNKRH